MLIQDIMTRKVVAIDPGMPIGDVYALMEQRNIRHFPIVDTVEPPGEDGSPVRLVGIVSDRDIRMVGGEHPAAPRGVSLKSPVREIMIRDVLTAHPLDPIEEAARILCEHKIGAMPVLDDGELVGIVTAIDFLEAVVRLTGVGEAATRIEVEVANRPGELASLLERVAERNYNVSSVMTTRQDEESITFVLRVGTIDGRGLANGLQEDGYAVLWPLEKTGPA